MAEEVERLVAAAILRDGKVMERGAKSHWELRMYLNPENYDHSTAIPGDLEGFVTSTGRFVDRSEAKLVAVASGQVNPRWKFAERDLLSSDINW